MSTSGILLRRTCASLGPNFRGTPLKRRLHISNCSIDLGISYATSRTLFLCPSPQIGNSCACLGALAFSIIPCARSAYSESIAGRSFAFAHIGQDRLSNFRQARKIVRER